VAHPHLELNAKLNRPELGDIIGTQLKAKPFWAVFAAKPHQAGLDCDFAAFSQPTLAPVLHILQLPSCAVTRIGPTSAFAMASAISLTAGGFFWWELALVCRRILGWLLCGFTQFLAVIIRWIL
jgi:hypothetical protein